MDTIDSAPLFSDHAATPLAAHRVVLPSLVFIAVFMALTGLVYPTIATLLGEALFARQANGSLIERNGVVVGSSLVAQPFVSERYFQPRPSAAAYDLRSLAGSNWAPGNPALRARIAASSREVSAREGVPALSIPGDLVTASGSGIDPHISPASARLQAARISRARGLPSERVQALVAVHTLPPTFGILGQPRVNVLELNLALDAQTTP